MNMIQKAFKRGLTHYGETKAQREADWMARFSDAVVTAEPKHAGKIEWPSAKHFFNSGMTPTDAARTYIKNRQGA